MTVAAPPGPTGDERARRYGRTVVTLLTVTVAVDYADRSALGAVAPALRSDLGLDLAQLGYLGAAFGLVGGVATLLAGVLVDRVPRMRMLAGSATAWAVAMVATGAAQTLLWLLLARAGLAVVLATVGPAYPSLVGDAVPEGQRGRALATVDSGQLVGGAVGVGVGATSVLLLSWRWAFWLLALPAVVLAFRYARTPEPRRRPDPATAALSLRAVTTRLWHNATAVRVLLAGTAASYYLAGASAFSVVFAVARYDVSTPVADLALVALGVGGVAGIVAGGRVTDRLAAGGRERLLLRWTAVAHLAAAALWLPALLVHTLAAALPFLLLGATALAATIPALDAVRVAVVAPGLRGRTESVRTLTRALSEGAAPLVFGVLASEAGGDDLGLQRAFLLALPGLVLAAVALVLAGRSVDADRRAAVA